MQVQSESNDVTEPADGDLSPLSWVLDELRKSLEGASKAIRRFVREANKSRSAGLGSLDTAQLSVACQQLHQAVGALEMVGQVAPAKMLRAMESLTQKFVPNAAIIMFDCTTEHSKRVTSSSNETVDQPTALRADSTCAKRVITKH